MLVAVVCFADCFKKCMLFLAIWVPRPMLCFFLLEILVQFCNKNALFDFIASCSWEGRQYRDGVEWTTSPCTKCRCRNGHTECLVAECQPVTCKAVSNNPELCLVFWSVSNSQGKTVLPVLVCKTTTISWNRDWLIMFRLWIERVILAIKSMLMCSFDTQNENLVVQPGQCCPQCEPDPCMEAGNEHKVSWKRD